MRKGCVKGYLFCQNGMRKSKALDLGVESPLITLGRAPPSPRDEMCASGNCCKSDFHDNNSKLKRDGGIYCAVVMYSY